MGGFYNNSLLDHSSISKIAAARRSIASSSSVAVAIFWRKRAVVSGKVMSTTSSERADLGDFLSAPRAMRLSICSATAETEERPRPAQTSL